MAGCLLHPQIHSSGFVGDTTRSLDLKERGAPLIRKILSSLSKTTPQQATKKANIIQGNSVIQKELGTGSFCLDGMFDLPPVEPETVDSISRYYEKSLSSVQLEQLNSLSLARTLRNCGIQIIQFWLTQD